MVFGFALFCISGCFRSADELCGADKVWSAKLGTEPVSERLDFLNGSRIFIFEDSNTPEDICADEHSSAFFRLELTANKFPPDTKATGVAYWGANFTNRINLEPGDNNLSNIGLKQVFKDEPGWIGLQIIFEFPTQGSLEKDKAFFRDHVKKFEITYYYNEHI